MPTLPKAWDRVEGLADTRGVPGRDLEVDVRSADGGIERAYALPFGGDDTGGRRLQQPVAAAVDQRLAMSPYFSLLRMANLWKVS